MSVYFMIGKPNNFPLCPFALDELGALPWGPGFRVISPAAYQLLSSSESSTRKDALLVPRKMQELKRAVREKRLIFDEVEYLAQHADVAEAVEQKSFRNGLSHYLSFGISENRSANLTLVDGDTELLRLLPVADFSPASAEQLQSKTPSVRCAVVSTYSVVEPAARLAVQYSRSENHNLLIFADSWLSYDISRTATPLIAKYRSTARQAVSSINLYIFEEE